MQELRDAGFSDADIFAMTVYVALRVALSTVNDALGPRPGRRVPDAGTGSRGDAVTFGRPRTQARSRPNSGPEPVRHPSRRARREPSRRLQRSAEQGYQ